MTRRFALFALLLATAAPATAHAQKMQGEMQVLRGACGPDVQRLCPGVQPGGGHIKACLMAKKDQVSVGCAKALLQAKQSKGK